MFQHRHYVFLAETLASIGQHNVAGITAKQKFMLIDLFAEKLEGTNLRFDRARFKAAANGEPINGRDK